VLYSFVIWESAPSSEDVGTTTPAPCPQCCAYSDGIGRCQGAGQPRKDMPTSYKRQARISSMALRQRNFKYFLSGKMRERASTSHPPSSSAVSVGRATRSIKEAVFVEKPASFHGGIHPNQIIPASASRAERMTRIVIRETKRCRSRDGGSSL
jgi:hypothetical protein